MASVCQIVILLRCLSLALASPMGGIQMQQDDTGSTHISGQLHLHQGLEFHVPDVASLGSTPALEYPSCCNISDDIADCTGCHLGYVPRDLPRNISHLLLADNNINSEALDAGVFANYPQLVALQLDSNNITVLPEAVFEGLESLKLLSLYNNSINLNWTFRDSKVFHPLNNTLETLIINRNTNDTNEQIERVYPDRALSVLKRLSHLYIDGLRNKDFGWWFQKMTSLTFLSMSGYKDGCCNMTSISNDTFSNVPHLTFLNISDCNLNGSQIDLGAFSPLGRLQVLDVSNNNNLGIQAVGNFMYGLRNNKHFTHLKMQRIVYRFTPCIVIYAHTLRYFGNTGLQVIEAMDNEIEMIEQGALDKLPPTLKIANLTNNRIMFGAYWKDMMSLPGLEQLHLDGYMNPVKFPLFFPSSNFRCPYSEPQKNETLSDSRVFDQTCVCGPGKCSLDGDDFILPLPPNLQNMTMHSNSLAYKVNNIRFCVDNNLTSVDLSGNMFSHLEGPITGLYNLKYLNLSSCFVQTIEEQFFDALYSLEHLNMFQNLLGDCLDKDLNGTIFDQLTNLKYLNLSFNNLYRLRWPVFKDLKHLETLDLSTNRISHINFKIDHMKHLTFLDLHKNDIANLPQDIRDLVDSLLNANKSVRIDLSENPIYCDCSNLDFLEWVIRTNIFGNNYELYYCKYPVENMTAVPMTHGYENEVAKLRKQCSNNVGLFLGVIGGTLLVVTSIVGLLLYRFRWTLRYWYHAAKLKIYSNPHAISEEFDYDVFVSYATEDVDFVLQELSPHLSAKRHLKLLVHGEKFQTGRHITDNIYMAIRQSRKTLVILTSNMLKSHWCNYELQMARMESINTGREVLVFLFLEDIPVHTMSVSMLSNIQTSTYISYPEDDQHRDAFWNKLANDLRAA